jgi:hypothetical protein
VLADVSREAGIARVGAEINIQSPYTMDKVISRPILFITALPPRVKYNRRVISAVADLEILPMRTSCLAK